MLPRSYVVQSINIRLFDDITTDIKTIAIYIAGLKCSKAKYPECSAANDLFIEHNNKNIILKTLAQNNYSQGLDAKVSGAVTDV